MPSRLKDTLWDIQPHTKAKLDILGHYLDAWLPIVSRLNPGHLVYLDGFAGPGGYQGGEDGSPLVALKAALHHPSPLSARLSYLFIEGRPDRADHLRRLVAGLSLPDMFCVRTENGAFANLAISVVDAAMSPRAPLFAFIDPNNWDVPYAVVRDLLARPGAEVFVNFMFDYVQRFLTVEQQEANWDALFGTPAWRDIRADPDPHSRARRIPALYRQQLQAAGARHVLAFEMRDTRGTTDYILFFATKHDMGMERMKEAMWKVDGSGGFRFRDPRHPDQPALLEPGPDFGMLRRQLCAEFRGKTVGIEQVEQYVLRDTLYLRSHLRRHGLTPLETAMPAEIRVSASPSRRQGQFPGGTKITFP